MTRWSSEFRLLAVAFVALSCSGRDAHAFALCEHCPELFASTPIAQQSALPQRRAQSTRPHDRYVNRRQHQRRDDPPSSPLLARRTGLTAFAAVPMGSGSSDANGPATMSDSAPLVAEAAVPATPALRIDGLFNLMAAGPSDQPDEALRASVLAQFRMRQSPDLDGGTGFLVPALIALAGGLLIGAVLAGSSLGRRMPAPRLGDDGRRRDPSCQGSQPCLGDNSTGQRVQVNGVVGRGFGTDITGPKVVWGVAVAGSEVHQEWGVA